MSTSYPAPIGPRTRIFVAGHRGMVGSAICRGLRKAGYDNLVTRSHAALDLTDQKAVGRFFESTRIDQVILAAAKVGGILANNTYPAEFIHQNLMIEANVIHGAYQSGVERLLFLGSSCIYPKLAPQPIREEYLLTGPLEPTNEPYAIAKIAGIKLCESYNRQYGTRYLALMPTNLYGPNDNYDLKNSHVLPALIRKFHLAKLAAGGDRQGIDKESAIYGPIPKDIMDQLAGSGTGPQRGVRVALWGSGRPRREFLHVDDLASACIFLMGMPAAGREEALGMGPGGEGGPPETAERSLSFLNVGTGKDIEIRELAALVREVVGFRGETVWDRSKPDGTPQKLLDVSRLTRAGWRPRIEFKNGIERTYGDYLSRLA